MDAVTGYVKAYVGGPDFYHFQYDMVSKGKRQVGSTVKPFLYALAMTEGDTPSLHLQQHAACIRQLEDREIPEADA